MTSFIETLLSFLLLLLSITTSVDAQDSCQEDYPNAILGPPVVQGKRFFDSISGNYIPVKGMAYYPRPNAGELADSDSVDYFSEQYRYIWEPDLQNFKELGINTLRIYAVDPTVDHSSFMCALQQAGIYVIVGLLADCKDCGIGPNTNDLETCYPASLKTRGQYIIQVFSKYPNVLAFSAGNEVSLFATNKTIENNAPCQKQFIRDMRAYKAKCGIRDIPVGVVVADPSSEERETNALYYNCRSNTSDSLENAEFYGINSYLHCDGSATTVEDLNGYTQLLSDFSDYQMNIPVVISEFGCRSRSFPTIDGFQSQRTWLQIDAIYSPDYLQEFAGGVIFEYSAEKKIADTSDMGNGGEYPYMEHTKLQYGVTYYFPVDCDHTTVECENIKYPEFDLLVDKLESVNVDSVPSLDAYNPPNLPFTQCPNSIPPLSDFDWPSAKQDDWFCPPEDDAYTCPCAATLAPTMAPIVPGSPTLQPTPKYPEGWVPTEPILPENSGARTSRGKMVWTGAVTILLSIAVVDIGL